MSACGTQDQSEKRFAPWRGPTEVPNTAQKRNMLIEALGIALSFVTKNCAYTFDNEMLLQRKRSHRTGVNRSDRPSVHGLVGQRD